MVRRGDSLLAIGKRRHLRGYNWIVCWNDFEKHLLVGVRLEVE